MCTDIINLQMVPDPGSFKETEIHLIEEDTGKSLKILLLPKRFGLVDLWNIRKRDSRSSFGWTYK
jgi:hypothetical protein